MYIEKKKNKQKQTLDYQKLWIPWGPQPRSSEWVAGTWQDLPKILPVADEKYQNKTQQRLCASPVFY